MQDLFLFPVAHVKWFTQAEFAPAQAIEQVLTLPFLLGALLTLAALLVLTRLNVPLQELPWVQRIHTTLDRVRPYSPWIIRIGMAVPLIIAGASGYLLHFELAPVPVWLKVPQVGLGLLLLIPATDRFAALGVIGLYVAGAVLFGLHHMLDYISWVGAAYYLLTRGTPAHSASIAVLYIATGLSLSWAAVEKWVFPDLALDIISQHAIPTFGFPAPAFLTLAGWVELAIGYLLITGVLNRFLSLCVTLLFVMTSSLFGLSELLGHWQLHAALIVFLAEGTGPHVTPVLWHRTLRLQLAFVGVTLIPYVAGLLALYYLL